MRLVLARRAPILPLMRTGVAGCRRLPDLRSKAASGAVRATGAMARMVLNTALRA